MAPPTAEVLLELKYVKKCFSGFWAVEGVDLRVGTGELRAIIGPNGSGKTTLFNLISGHLRCDGGTVLFRGEDIHTLPPDKICQKGISRTFQITSIFPKLTAIENVQVALFARHGQALRLFDKAKTKLYEEALELLQSVVLDSMAHQVSGTLAHGDQKRLELAIALANRPALLLLDEPTAGMPTRQRHETMALVSRVVRERGLTLLFTEHDMDVVFATAESISVLHQGRLLAEGTPDEVRSNNQVQEVYLGWKRLRS